MRAILLGAGQGTRLRPLTDDRPKCMVEVGGRPLLDWQIRALRAAGVDDIVLVRGYSRSRIQAEGIRCLDNGRWAETNMVQTLRCASEELQGEVLVAYTDLLYRPELVHAARASSADVGVLIDRQWRSLWERRMENPLEDAETLRLASDGRILEIGQRPRSLDEIQGQYIGLVRLSAAGCEIVRGALERAAEEDRLGRPVFGGERGLDAAYLTDLLTGLIAEGVPVMAIPVDGGWCEVDSPADLRVANEMLAEGLLDLPEQRKAS